MANARLSFQCKGLIVIDQTQIQFKFRGVLEHPLSLDLHNHYIKKVGCYSLTTNAHDHQTQNPVVGNKKNPNFAISHDKILSQIQGFLRQPQGQNKEDLCTCCQQCFKDNALWEDTKVGSPGCLIHLVVPFFFYINRCKNMVSGEICIKIVKFGWFLSCFRQKIFFPVVF